MWSVEGPQQTTVLKEVPKGVRIVCGRRGTRFVTHPFCDCRPRCSLLMLLYLHWECRSQDAPRCGCSGETAAAGKQLRVTGLRVTRGGIFSELTLNAHGADGWCAALRLRSCQMTC
jgi:hypothetical protein